MPQRGAVIPLLLFENEQPSIFTIVIGEPKNFGRRMMRLFEKIGTFVGLSGDNRECLILLCSQL